jgi:hypothetical protein
MSIINVKLASDQINCLFVSLPQWKEITNSSVMLILKITLKIFIYKIKSIRAQFWF